ncbi:tetratricopeptide repeat protein [Alphaproteobacteria bacterium GH1-50]|uniref:Tetratricopeptide repeat protein n=1 Tax=Kangsaoukella pontilimi TaxID=2691042 RepID=A0A7C9MXZ5_9RHOB|nr:tetratricopeptide repeat protein [Kangsaoukella pontilimi]MXQ08734.1 tetratricopeptide repeat protein [Kangsaoukella pontilimi]
MRLSPIGTAILVMALAACENSGGLSQSDDSPFAPPTAADGLEQSVDGLVVGHRLMAAGEYELALKAYLRAAASEGINVDVLSAIGSANLQLGRLNQAEQILRRATELDETFPPAWNNLGVVLMEKGEYGEASRVFRLAFALDSGRSPEIRDNLRLALAKLDNTPYSEDEDNFRLVRRGPGFYQLLSTAETP